MIPTTWMWKLLQISTSSVHTCNTGDPVWSLSWEAPHSSTLAWRIPWTEEPGGLQSTGSQRAGHGWVTKQAKHSLAQRRCRCQPIFFIFPWFLFLNNFTHIGHFFFSCVFFIALPLPFDVNWPRLSNMLSILLSLITNYYNKGVKVLVAQSCLTLCDPIDCSHQLLCPWDSPGKNTEVDCHSPLQGIFQTQRLNPGLPHCRQILY